MLVTAHIGGHEQIESTSVGQVLDMCVDMSMDKFVHAMDSFRKCFNNVMDM